jgi:hypothetical protein
VIAQRFWVMVVAILVFAQTMNLANVKLGFADVVGAVLGGAVYIYWPWISRREQRSRG